MRFMFRLHALAACVALAFSAHAADKATAIPDNAVSCRRSRVLGVGPPGR